MFNFCCLLFHVHNSVNFCSEDFYCKYLVLMCNVQQLDIIRTQESDSVKLNWVCLSHWRTRRGETMRSSLLTTREAPWTRPLCFRHFRSRRQQAQLHLRCEETRVDRRPVSTVTSRTSRQVVCAASPRLSERSGAQWLWKVFGDPALYADNDACAWWHQRTEYFNSVSQLE